MVSSSKMYNDSGRVKRIISPFDTALKYLSFRQRSVKEMHDYLAKKQYPEDEINETIKKLLKLHFLNDEEFARTFTELRQRKGKSKRTISFELKLKGIDRDHAEEVLNEAKDDYKTALSFIEKRIGQFEKLEPEERKKKIINRLRMRGYNWDTISKVLKKLPL